MQLSLAAAVVSYRDGISTVDIRLGHGGLIAA
jgi:hypothetical protein